MVPYANIKFLLFRRIIGSTPASSCCSTAPSTCNRPTTPSASTASTDCPTTPPASYITTAPSSSPDCGCFCPTSSSPASSSCPTATAAAGAAVPLPQLSGRVPGPRPAGGARQAPQRSQQVRHLWPDLPQGTMMDLHEVFFWRVVTGTSIFSRQHSHCYLYGTSTFSLLCVWCINILTVICTVHLHSHCYVCGASTFSLLFVRYINILTVICTVHQHSHCYVCGASTFSLLCVCGASRFLLLPVCVRCNNLLLMGGGEGGGVFAVVPSLLV